MPTIIHLSDLHIVNSSHWNNIRACILNKARELTGEKLLIVTGDFHNFGEGNYDKALEFLKELITELKIYPKQDVFVVPGNHDVGSDAAMKSFFPGDDWELRQQGSVSYLKQNNSASKNYKKFVDQRLESYTPYCAFVRELGIYPDDAGLLPATVHVRCWRGRLNILHLNTTLIADGSSKTDQQLDILTATGNDIWREQNTALPALALGHNSFYDLDKRQQIALKRPFTDYRVCAYLCGDTHEEEIHSEKQLIRLDNGYDTDGEVIPNVVCVKGAADNSDKFSDFGLYLHEWDEASGRVPIRLLRWRPDRDQTAFHEESEKGYHIPRLCPNEMQRENERLREQLKQKDGAPPPDTDREKEARALWIAGRDGDALALLSDPKRREPMESTVRQYISENLLRIDILRSKGVNRDTIPEIRNCYEECVELAKTHRVSVYVIFDYIPRSSCPAGCWRITCRRVHRKAIRRL